MFDSVAVMTLLVAAVASLFMAWVIGAGSSGATPFAPAVGANAIPVMRAAFVVGLLGFLGAVTQGASVSQTVGGGLVEGVTLPATGVILALVTAAGLMAVGIAVDLPIATAFTVTGSVVGIGLAMGGTPAWETYSRIGAVWLLTPLVGGGVAYGLASLLPRERLPESCCVPLLAVGVTALVTNVRFAFLGPTSVGQSVSVVVGDALPLSLLAGRLVVTVVVAAAVGYLVFRDIRSDTRRGLNHFLLGVGGLVAFSAGGSQVGLAVGPLVPLLDKLAIPVWAVLVGGGAGLLAGSWMGAPRMIKSLSQDYSSLGPRRSISALVPAFGIAQAAVLLGVPVSFNEIIVSAILGSGLAVSGGISTRKLLWTVVAWVGSLVLSFVVGYGVFAVLLA